jgi:hypothetical protein
MTRVNAELAKNNSLWLAWVSSLFASTAVVLVLGVWVLDSRGVLGFGGNSYIGRTGHDADRGVGNGKVGYLSSTQVKFLCTRWGETLEPDDDVLKEWACSICLEDNEAGCETRTVNMPCSHRFHRAYVFDHSSRDSIAICGNSCSFYGTRPSNPFTYGLSSLTCHSDASENGCEEEQHRVRCAIST